ncbi:MULTISPECIES: hypothetical protein [unclassified Streptomyces]|uniref:hypothetical protein n=1 Tax=unclassified Streptomyces TaxID=2593676 RepID=UPI00382E604C
MILEDPEETLRRLENEIGGIVEIWVPRADFDAWNAAVEALQARGYRIEFTRSGASVAGPLTAEMFSDDSEQGEACEMYVDVGTGRWWTGIFSTELIDFQGRPEWIASIRELAEISDFMQILADATRKETIFIPESLDGNVKRYMIRNPKD